MPFPPQPLPYEQLTHEEYITLHPKLELHAHISGSINEHTLLQLIRQHWPNEEEYQQKLSICKLLPSNHHDTRDLDECFALFKVLHHIIDSKEVIYKITLQVLEDFVFRDQCCYLEMKTTPRPIRKTIDNADHVVVTAYEYIHTVCSAMVEFRAIIAYLSRTFGIKTIHDEYNHVITGCDQSLAQFSPYAQEMIGKYTNIVEQHQVLTQDIHTLWREYVPNSLSPTPVSSPTPTTPTDCATPTPPTCTQLTPHYHNNIINSYTVLNALKNFVSCCLTLSIDRAGSSLDDCDALLNYIKQIDALDATQQQQSSPQTNDPQSSPSPSSTIFNKFSEVITGVDFSGNPFAKQTFTFYNKFWSATKQPMHTPYTHFTAQQRNQDDAQTDQPTQPTLFSSIHFAETKNWQDSRDILAFLPNRLGHAAVLNKELFDLIVAHHTPPTTEQTAAKTLDNANTALYYNKMGVEICLTSNQACKLHTTIQTHPFIGFLAHNIQHNFDPQYLIPLTLCTDDSGVFSCSLVDEWLQLLKLEFFNSQLQGQQQQLQQGQIFGAFDLQQFDKLEQQESQQTVISLPQNLRDVEATPQQQKMVDFTRINALAQSGAYVIFQKQYQQLVFDVMNAYKP